MTHSKFWEGHTEKPEDSLLHGAARVRRHYCSMSEQARSARRLWRVKAASLLTFLAGVSEYLVLNGVREHYDNWHKAKEG